MTRHEFFSILPNSNYRNLTKYIIKTCKENDVKIIIETANRVFYPDPNNQNDYSTGYFDPFSEHKQLAFSIYKHSLSSWFSTLVHEFCHLEQWLDDPKGFDKFCEATAIFYSEVERGYRSKDYDKAKKLVIKWEMDCEKRLVEKFIQFKIPVYIPDIIKQSNCYIYAFEYFSQVHGWEPGVIYQSEVIQRCPDKFFNTSDYLIIPSDLRDIFNTWTELHKTWQTKRHKDEDYNTKKIFL